MTGKQDYDATVTLDINAPIEAVWAALTEPELVKQYMYGANLVTDWSVGGQITWSGAWEGKPYQDKGIVLGCEPNKRLQYTHWSPLSGVEDKSENYHTVTVALRENKESTGLTLTQSNNPSQAAADTMANNGWRPMMLGLKTVAEAQSNLE